MEDLQQYENEINNPTVKNGWIEARGDWSYKKEGQKKNEKQRFGKISLVPAVEQSYIFSRNVEVHACDLLNRFTFINYSTSNYL